ncbi:alpha-L-rhamnosidase-related protein [Paenibacillus silvisoli]|uniref:alpha-L-rhamnosidase-related protein n=1 Tax=Paenibacillus silvisoli TaxID=3110539 RepID=UPI0028061803|nr:alpha-L-rhamnosidase C-terminal domain-containing protein [Paenibacillus silvisoli]
MEENRKWQAKWIWPHRPGHGPGTEVNEPQIAYFRRSFNVSDPSDSHLTVSVSADSRYRLWLNGEPVSSGPLKGDLNTHYYEVVDVSDKLRKGENVWSAQVIYYAGRTGPASVWRSDMGAFLLDGQLKDGSGQLLEELSTDNRWRTLRLGAGAFLFEKETFTLFIGGGERVDGGKLPIGFIRNDYDDRDWTDAVVVSNVLDPMFGQLTRWQLSERSIPPMRETVRPFARIMQGQCGTRTWDTGESPDSLIGLELAPGEKLTIELDTSRMTSGYPRVSFYGGKGAKAAVLYAESYEFPPEGHTRNKGVRDDMEGKSLIGFEDYYTVAGAGDAEAVIPESYEPIHRRGFRFIRVTVQAGDEPVTLAGIDYRQSGYPLEELASFDGSDSTFQPLWEISLNTLRGCMHETYEDTPFYEQMQYELDSRLQALFTYTVSGDDRLGRKTIRDFHSSLLPSGILQSRYPSVDRQVIPGFALFWIMMVYDHYMHYGDASLVKAYRPTIDAVLGWFENRREADSGLVGQMPEGYWSFVDWTVAWQDNAGAPHAARKGPLTVYSLMYADALVKSAEMFEWTGRKEMGTEYRERAASVRDAVRERCWSDERGMFRDGPAVEDYSQHAQVWAVLTGTVQGGEAKALTERILGNKELAQISTAMSYYLFRALAMTGLYDKTFKLWDAWRVQVDLHLTAWVEDPVSERSDCHAWGALPLYEFPAELLGIKPLKPGFAEIGIAPVIGELGWAKGRASTPLGLVDVSWRREDDRFTIEINAPAGVPVTVSLPNGESRSLPEAAGIELSCEAAAVSSLQ